jgi:hypothetical protein
MRWLSKVVGKCKSVERSYKKALSKGMVMHKDFRASTIVKAMAENKSYAIEQARLRDY